MIIKKIVLGLAIISMFLGTSFPTAYAAFSSGDHESASVDQLYCAAEKSNYDDKQECFQSPAASEQSQDTGPNLLVHTVFILILLAVVGIIVFILSFRIKHRQGRSSNR